MSADFADAFRLSLILAFLVTPACADEGDDFVNNFSTDLAPIISLFGERVVMQFLGQSLGLADCVALAVAPIGIITIIVSAIRAGGPRWLKAIIGRARENTATVEAELMSSTSKETCEMWNGDSVVRCQGSGKVSQFVCLVPDKRVIKDNPYDVKLISLEEARGAPFNDDGSPTSTPCLREAGEEPPFPRTRDDHFDDQSEDVTVFSRIKRWFSQHLDASILSALCRMKGCRHLQRSPSPDAEEGTLTCPSLSVSDIGRNIASNPELRNFHGTIQDQPDGTQQRSSQTSPDTYNQPTQDPVENHHIIVVRDPTEIAPNLALNCHNRPRRREIILAAIGGIILQTGVLIWCALSVSKDSLAEKLKKNDRNVKEYALFLVIIGTFLQTSGLLVCGWVVEHRTQEAFYKAVKGYSIYLIWLQEGGAVDDQEFKSYSIFPMKKRSYISISRRKNDVEEKINEKDGRSSYASEKDSTMLKWWTFSGCAIALVGFFSQFTGLRGMNYSVPLAQFLAMLIMTCARAFIRRGLVVSPFTEELRPGFELDWFAKSLGEEYPCWMNEKTWARSKGVDNAADMSADSHATTVDGTTHHDETRITEPPPGKDHQAQNLLITRRKLARFSGFKGPFSKEAVLLAQAVERIASELFNPELKEFTWPFEVVMSGKLCSFSFTVKYEKESWRARADDFEALLSLYFSSISEEKDGPKDTQLDDGDGWLRSQRLDSGLRLHGPIPKSYTLMRDFRYWLPEPVKEILEVEEYTGSVPASEANKCIDVASHSVVGDDPNNRVKKNQDRRNFRVCRTCTPRQGVFFEGEAYFPDRSSDSSNIWKNLIGSYTLQELKGKSNTASHKSRFLAIRSFDSPEHLFARQFFCSFVQFAATERVDRRQHGTMREAKFLEYPESRCEGGRTGPTLKMKNNKVTAMAEGIAGTGFSSLSDAFLDVVAALSMEQGLAANYGVMLRHLRDALRDSTSNQSWKEAQSAFMALFEIALTLDATGAMLAPQALALCQYNSGMLNYAITTYQKEREPRRSWPSRPEKLIMIIQKSQEFFAESLDVETHLQGPCSVFKDQFCIWPTETGRSETVQHLRLSKADRIRFQLSSEFLQIAPLDAGDRSHLFFSTKDVFEWTPLHYYAAIGIIRTDHSKLLEDFASLGGSTDIIGFQPLHYACLRGRLEAAKQLQVFGRLDLVQEDGLSAMHLAISSGSVELVQYMLKSLKEWKGDERTSLSYEDYLAQARDFNGRAPVHWAAMLGHVEMIKVLKDEINLRDKGGWNCLHLAIVHQRRELVEWLLQQSPCDANAIDNQGRTPLHLAVTRADPTILEIVAASATNLDAKDMYGDMPLYLAMRNGNNDAAQLLIRKGASIDTENQSRTSLQYAIKE